MAENLRIDSHKLIYHPERVCSLLKGEKVYPLTVEISPSGACNHRCVFCAFDYLEYKKQYIDKDIMIKNLKIMSKQGVKAIVVAGEGEPLLNKGTPEIINSAKKFGLDVGMSSNAILFTKKIAEECLESLTWIRVSLNAGTSESYDKIHMGRKGDYDLVIKNLYDIVQVKKEKNLETTIGVQLLLIPENQNEVLVLARKLKEIGVDYFTVKPFSQHPKSENKIEILEFKYSKFLELEKELKKLETDDYKIFFRSDSMQRLDNGIKEYNCCLGLPLWAYVDSNLKVWACLAYIGEEEFCYGDLKEKDVNEIWESERYHDIVNMTLNMDISRCRDLCRLDKINKYLYELKYPGRHVNFI